MKYCFLTYSSCSEAYYSLAALLNTDLDAARKQRKAGNGNLNPNAVTDVWLLEMHYRMAVAYLTTVWEKSSKELTNLFAGMKEMECNRRFRLRELLVLFMERSKRLWNSIPPLLTPVLEEVNKTPTDLKEIEKDVSDKIREKAQELQKSDEVYQGPGAKDPMNGPGLQGVPEPDTEFELQSPLMSGLICKVEVIYRKCDKMLSMWRPCLAVTTSDNYMHLFEIPAIADVKIGDSPDAAFQALVPPVEVPTEDAVLEGYVPNGKTWFDHLTPEVSFDLKNCSISLNQEKGGATFEITETLLPGPFRREKSRKYALKLKDSQDVVTWLLALRELGAN